LVLGFKSQWGHGSLELYMRIKVPFGSIEPPPSVSNKSNASLISSTSSSVRPGR
jgi:hypothetical protein